MSGQTHAPNPARIITFSFFLAILAGTLLLSLPFSTALGRIRLSDALFTATSAVCVTGLSVVDIGTTFTRFGQIVIMILIQLGGLGIMTFSAFFLSLLGRRASITDRFAFRMITEKFASVNLFRALLAILSVTLVLEGLGAAFLFLRFQEMFPFPKALYYSIFHAISAFCNAGFSLFPESLIGFQEEFLVPAVMMTLIFLGGLGFFVLTDAVEKIGNFILRRKSFRVSLHAKIVLTTTVFLILSGTVIIWLLERGNLLSSLPLPLQIWNALFQSITPRTAGFNTLQISSLSDATLFFIGILMFIGGAPASTAGGIKVTTFGIFLAMVWCQARGREGTSLFKRKVPQQVIARSLAILVASFALINLMTFLLAISEHQGLPPVLASSRFLSLFFEVLSAFGTVGLSMGLTPTLTLTGKLLIIFTMFVGRLGPLTLALAVAARRPSEVHFEYAEEEVIVG